MSTTPIVQFGTSRFLQAHVDLFVSDANARNAALGDITIVQSSGSAARAHRLAALASPDGFPVHIRGVSGGTVIDEETRVNSVTRALSASTDWPEITRIVAEEALIILSNTSDAGFRPTPADTLPEYDPAMSYPAKLTNLLWARFKANQNPIQVMPTELIPQNGDCLRELVLDLAKPLSADLHQWIATQVTFVNSLVDRIVSEPIEPAGAVAEPYALWAIQDCPNLILPCDHPAVQVVPSLDPIEAKKLFILNLGHTYLVAGWLARNKSGGGLVRDVMNTPDIRADLVEVYDAEVLPGFAAAGMGAEAEDYIQIVLDRFSNPFLEHALADIAQNHAEKVQRRIASFVDWARSHGCTTDMPRLGAIVSATQAEQ